MKQLRTNRPEGVNKGEDECKAVRPTIQILEGSERETGIIHVLFLSHNGEPNEYRQTESEIDGYVEFLHSCYDSGCKATHQTM